MAKQNMLKFNIKNVKYSTGTTVEDLTYATSLSLQLQELIFIHPLISFSK